MSLQLSCPDPNEILYWSSHLGKVMRLYHKHRLLCVMVKRAVGWCILIAQRKAEGQQVWQPVTSPSLWQVVQSRLCVCVCVCVCVWMIRSVYHFPLRVAFQRDIPSRWRECWSAKGGTRWMHVSFTTTWDPFFTCQRTGSKKKQQGHDGRPHGAGYLAGRDTGGLLEL